MPNIESTLKQFLLLSSIAFIAASQPSYALSSTGSAQMASSDAGLVMITAKLKHRPSLKLRKTVSSRKCERFATSFQIPFLPAINE
jgi:hypothetical protein